MLHRVSAVDALVKELRRQILAGELPPGTVLPEIELAQRFHVARPTVRSAVQELVDRGVLRREAGRSARVPVLGEDDVRDVYFARAAIELRAIEFTTTAQDLEALLEPVAEALAGMEEVPADAAWSEMAEADLAFHSALVRATGSERLVRMFEDVLEEVRLCLVQLEARYPQRDELVAEHRGILEAIRAGDPDVARRQMLSHLDSAVRDLTRQ
jgi:DNA-binding GntR family transcriptional regulator